MTWEEPRRNGDNDIGEELTQYHITTHVYDEPG